ncbi:DUF2752 domain-containing protein [Streptomyces milbemycinicus]|uniref:DUF2752 domain-containing protein n=1 Tax=Streptomyces milbemycinicus TaxID=476552 RepID=UPI003F4D6C8B
MTEETPAPEDVPPVPPVPPDVLPDVSEGGRGIGGRGGGLVRRLGAPAGALAAVLAAFAFVGLVDPNEPGHYPACPLLRLTGVYCPGCGGLRSAYAIAHGEPFTALGANALAVFGYLGFAVVWLRWFVVCVRGRPAVGVAAPVVPLRAAHGWVICAVVLGFTVIRNLPFGSFLTP